MSEPSQVDIRLHVLKAVDGVLAALQSTFAQDNLLDGGNPYLYISEDPKGSKVWICDPDSREGYERGGNRMCITVSRGDVQPMDMHLHNQGQGSWNDPKQYSDIYSTPVFIRCEAGNKIQSETLASIVAQILKFFRQDLMTEFDIHEISVKSISSPTKIENVQGEPWQTSVIIQVQTQEMFQISTLMNQVNKINLVKTFKKNAGKRFDTSLNPYLTVGPQNGVAETE